MDTEFESLLLKRIDGFLAAQPNFGDFLAFDRGLRETMAGKSEEAAGELASQFDGLSIRELSDVHGEVTSVVYRRLDEQMPEERRGFFLLVAERAAWTAESVSMRERSAGWGTLDDFKLFLAKERESYRSKWGV